MAFCPNCGVQNRNEAEFCKNCGYNLKVKDKNIITRLNSNINIFGVFIGLVISLIVLLIASLLSGFLVISGQLDIIGFAYLVLLSMMFIGGFATSLTCCKTYSEGLSNGGLLGLITLVNFGFIIGALWFSTMAVVSSLAKAFSSFGSSSSSGTLNPYNQSTGYTPTTNTPTTNTSFNDMLPLIEIILLPFLIVLFAMAGGWFGVFIKKTLK